jgi:hypothetical protein
MPWLSVELCDHAFGGMLLSLLDIVAMMRYTFWLLLAFALFSGSAYSRGDLHPDTKNPNKGRPYIEQRGSDQSPVVVKIVTSPEAEANAAEEKQHRAESAIEEKRLTNATVALAVVTTLLALFTAGLWWVTYKLASEARETSTRQAQEMGKSLKLADEAVRTTRDAYIASERPWVSVGAVVNTPLVRKDGGVDFGVLFTVKNHGRSPAINVRIHYEVVALRVAPPQLGGVRERIEELGKVREIGDTMGIQLFPSETQEIRWTSPLTKSEIEAARLSYSRPGYLPSFFVIGSVFYETPFSDETYVLDWAQSGGGDFQDFEDPIPANRVGLVFKPYGKGNIN